VSNVFSILEAYNRDTLILINTPGIKRLLRSGARVKFKSNLEEGKYYVNLHFMEGPMASVKGKICIVKSIDFDKGYFTILENVYNYSLEMLEGVYLN